MISLESLIKNFRNFKILIAGDQAPARRDVRTILQALGFSNFREAEDGDDALRQVRAQRFDFLISELEMPFLNGLDLAAALRGDQGPGPVPMIIALEKAIELQAGNPEPSPADAFIVKPLSPQSLEDVMAAVLFKRLGPTPLDARLQAAGTAMAKNDFKLAHGELDEAARIAPRSAMVAYFRRLVFEAEGRPAKADQAIRKARDLFAKSITGPREAEKRIQIGRRMLAQGHLEEAREAFAQALEYDPDNPARKAEIGEVFLASGQAAEAEHFFVSSIKENPDDISLYNRLGIAYRKQKKFAAAVANYRKAIAIDPHEENLRYNLARAYLSAGDKDNALLSLREAIKISPDFREAQNLLLRLS
ncbi:MAG: tetratricopeptide repeat protein [Pseudomonadota bacterium]